MGEQSDKNLSKHFNHQEVEARWYKHWMENKYFKSVPNDKTPYTIVIPPPNVTGVLHMGHMLNNTIQDVLIRKARMQGFNACWVPGTDHASIATEAKVVEKLKMEGIEKSDITREEFLQHAFEWKDKYGGIILDQLKKLGASCDWDRTRFTMEESLSKAVIKVFVNLYQKGLIYQGYRITNWDPSAKTALGNEEVIYEEVNSNLYYVRYPIAGRDGYITIATTRPETILGDTAICVHPDDERYAEFKGVKAIVPLINREIPFIFDTYVDMEFGTGALKVTPAHDENDYALGQKHDLETINIFNEDGTLNECAQLYVGQDRFTVRKLITKDLNEAGFLVKTEAIKNKVGYSERTKVVVEPRLTHQWFLKMSELVDPALENVMNDNIQFFPSRFKNLYKHWLENIRDWCISRQLWWGQQIPAYYLNDGSVYVAETKEAALILAQIDKGDAIGIEDLKQEEDVVDTWFSSWLWPISVFDGFETNKEVDYYYPTNVLVTGWDIIFFWVARMIFAGYEFRNEKPFQHVYFTGMVRDMQRRKMSKSLGNSPDALKLIEDYGADGVRLGILLSAPAGNDLLFDLKYCEQGRNFSNKIWNALKLVKSWEVKPGFNPNNHIAFDWMDAKLNQSVENMEASFKEYRLSEALMTMYTLVWDDFCSWLLEIIKPAFGEAIDAISLEKTLDILGQLMKLLHPFMPFLTEEVHHQLKTQAKDIIVSEYPIAKEFSIAHIQKGELIKTFVTAMRDIRTKYQLKIKDPLKVVIHSADKSKYDGAIPIISKLAYLNSVTFSNEEPLDAISILIGKDKVYVILSKEIDIVAEIEKMEEEIKYLEGFIKSVDKKLSNTNFVNNAPQEVLTKEQKKKEDGELKIKILKDSLEKLK